MKKEGYVLEHVKALAIKMISLFVILWAVLGGIYGVTVGNILTITITFSLIEYIVGDLLLLRYTNNITATAGDFGLALIIIGFMTRNMTTIDNIFTLTLIASICVTIFEYFFHKYVYRNVYNHNQDNVLKFSQDLRYQTEMSEELTDIKRKKE